MSGVLSVPYAEAFEALEPVESPGGCTAIELAARVPRQIRQHARDALARSLEPRTAGVAGALLLGIRSGLAPEDRAIFQRTGTMHLFAISGLHVGIAAGLLLGALRLLVIPRPLALPTIALFLATYCSVTGGSPSVLRSSVMLLAFLGGRALGRRPRPVNTLAAAALLLLLAQPSTLFDPGFLLSFAAVASILAFASRIPSPPASTRPDSSPASRLARKIARTVVLSIRITAAAWAGTLPITVTLYGAITPAVFLGNLLLLPIVTLLLAIGLPALPLLALVPAASPAVAPLLEGLVRLLLVTAALVDHPMLRPIPIAPPPASGIALFYAALLLGASRHSRAAAVAFCASVTVTAMTSPDRAASVPELRILDVGQGACAIFRHPDGSCAVIDAGSSSVDDVGERVLLPALRALGVTTIDVLALSHADSDHVNGAPALLRGVPVARLVHPDRFERDPAGRRILRLARSRGVSTLPVAAGAMLLSADTPPARLVVVHPPRQWKDRTDLSDNDVSLAIMVEANGHRVLVPGDVEETGITALAQRLRGKVTGIVLPHHGAFALNLGSFLDEIDPEFAVVSARSGFTPGRVLEEIDARGVESFATWESARVYVSLGPDGPAVRPFVTRASARRRSGSRRRRSGTR